MKRKQAIFVGAMLIGAMGLAWPTEAHADHDSRWRFSLGVGDRGGYFDIGYRRHRRSREHVQRRSYRRHRRHQPDACSHARLRPIYKRVWVAPVYRSVHIGYDDCGRPTYRRICVRAGYYKRVLSHYTCRVCRFTVD